MTVPPFENRAVRGRILLLERTSLLREVQQLLLRGAGYEAFAADDPAVALGELELHRIDLVLVDATHREFVAADFLVTARRIRPVSFVAVVWQPGTLSPDDLRARGIDRVIESPTSAREIIETVDDVMGCRITPAAPTVTEATLPGAGLDRVRIRGTDRMEVRPHVTDPAPSDDSASWKIDNACTRP